MPYPQLIHRKIGHKEHKDPLSTGFPQDKSDISYETICRSRKNTRLPTHRPKSKIVKVHFFRLFVRIRSGFFSLPYVLQKSCTLASCFIVCQSPRSRISTLSRTPSSDADCATSTTKRDGPSPLSHPPSLPHGPRPRSTTGSRMLIPRIPSPLPFRFPPP